MPIVLPPLPYAYNALEPFIDTLTMQIHHTRHHISYVNNLVAALQGHSDLQSRSLAELLANLGDMPAALRDILRNNGGGHINHSIFWATLAPPTAGGGGAPTGSLAQAITAQLGSVANVKELVNEAGAQRFGSGWGWLVVDNAGQLLVYGTPNQDTPYMQGHTPLLGIDVWEHAYYLRYQNRRADYLEAFWNVLNWHAVEQRYEAAMTIA
ncbi:MAG: superoxide dismutase [Chloroflexales bacterium]|nr:superoxide dismutase [Chloroflexales bacterium]